MNREEIIEMIREHLEVVVRTDWSENKITVLLKFNGEIISEDTDTVMVRTGN